MDSHENKKYDIPAKPQAGANDPKGKQTLLDKTPHGRHRPPNTEDKIKDATEQDLAGKGSRRTTRGRVLREHKLIPTAYPGGSEHKGLDHSP